jgi:translocation and assembly module TamB
VHLAIAEGQEIPITVEGQAIGDAWGRVDVTLKRSAETKSTKIRVDLPEIHLDLPELDPTTLQDLDLAENVRIGAHRRDGQFISLPVQPISNESQVEGEAMLVEVHLGRSVWIQRGRELKVQLGGDLLARIASKTTLEGRLELKGGKLDVSGKMFDIEGGVVTFDGDEPGNPSIVATARWDSPTEYRVFAEYAGTVKDGKLTLRSDPPLSSDKVLSLLMFGTPDDSFGAAGTQSQGGESSSVAVGVAGDSAVKGLNRAISGVTKLDVSARLDTSTGTARPELDVQISPRVTARMTVAIGEPAAGQSPDRTFLTFEMRLLRAWALSAVVGDHGGSGLDLLWRRRY